MSYSFPNSLPPLLYAIRMKTLRAETRNGVGIITFTRAAEYNTITPDLRDELAAAIDRADADRDARVILLRAEGPAFCAGYALESSTRAQAGEPSRKRVWDSVADYGMISQYVNVYMKLWYARKPTIAAVHGWCIGGGTDMVLCADLIIAAESASFGYPPSRVWGTPTTAMWVYRMGLERAKRYLLTGDEIPAIEAARIGLILETVPDAELDARASASPSGWRRCPPINSRCSSCYAITRPRTWGWRVRGWSARCSTESRVTRRKASISLRGHRPQAFARQFASATIHSATMARARARRIERRRRRDKGKLDLM